MIIKQYGTKITGNNDSDQVNKIQIFKLFDSSVGRYTRVSIDGNSSVGHWREEVVRTTNIMNGFHLRSFSLEIIY